MEAQTDRGVFGTSVAENPAQRNLHLHKPNLTSCPAAMDFPLLMVSNSSYRSVLLASHLLREMIPPPPPPPLYFQSSPEKHIYFICVHVSKSGS